MRRGLLASREELARLRDSIGRHPFDTIYETLRKRCGLILQTRPISETEWQAQHAQGRWSAATLAARNCQGRIFDLIICHHIDPNVAYRDRAIEEVKSLIGWSTWTDPSHRGVRADLCTAECATTVAVALDWLEEDLGEPDRLRCLQALRNKGVYAYADAVAADDWWYGVYHNWNAVINAGCGLAALALADDDPRAAAALDKARAGLSHFFDALGREGGWDEGIVYWAYALRYLLMFGEALDRQLDDRTLFHQRGMEATGAFGVYFSPRGQSASFGDSGGVPLFGALYGLARRFGHAEVCWWLDRYAFHRDVRADGWSDAGLSLLWRPVDIEPEPQPDLSVLKVYNEIGWAAIADHWPEPDLYVAVKTGDLSAHHGQLDMNAIQVQVDGEMLLADLGHPPVPQYFSGDRFGFYEAQARAHNTLVIGERDHEIEAQGQIVEASEQPAYRWLTANAGSALGRNARYNRHVVMLLDARGQGQTLLVLDEVHNALREPVRAFWHTFAQLHLKDRTGAIVGDRTGLHFRLEANVPLTCKTATHRVGKATETALEIATERTDRLILVSAFSRTPIDTLALHPSARGDLSLEINATALRFKGSRKHLRLEAIEPIRKKKT